MTRRFSETLHGGFLSSYDAKNVLFEDKTEHQHLVLFENEIFGKVLMLDEVTQVTTSDEFIYHEMLSHVPILAHGGVKSVLIIGGGDCGLAEEVLKHASIERLVQVEIDQSVVDFSKEHFAKFNASVFDDDRFQLIIDDGVNFVRKAAEKFDLIIVDSTDPIGPGAVLFSDEFYEGCHKSLKSGGILVSQNGVPFLQGAELRKAMNGLRKQFSDVTSYIICVPTYVGGHMTLGWSSDDPALRQVDLQTLERRFNAAGIETRYYNPAVHIAAFALPNYIYDLVKPE